MLLWRRITGIRSPPFYASPSSLPLLSSSFLFMLHASPPRFIAIFFEFARIYRVTHKFANRFQRRLILKNIPFFYICKTVYRVDVRICISSMAIFAALMYVSTICIYQFTHYYMAFLLDMLLILQQGDTKNRTNIHTMLVRFVSKNCIVASCLHVYNLA